MQGSRAIKFELEFIGLEGGGYAYYCRLMYYAVRSGKYIIMFRRKMLPTFSTLKMKPIISIIFARSASYKDNNEMFVLNLRNRKKICWSTNRYESLNNETKTFRRNCFDEVRGASELALFTKLTKMIKSKRMRLAEHAAQIGMMRRKRRSRRRMHIGFLWERQKEEDH